MITNCSCVFVIDWLVHITIDNSFVNLLKETRVAYCLTKAEICPWKLSRKCKLPFVVRYPIYFILNVTYLGFFLLHNFHTSSSHARRELCCCHREVWTRKTQICYQYLKISILWTQCTNKTISNLFTFFSKTSLSLSLV